MIPKNNQKTNEEMSLELSGLKRVPDEEDMYYNRVECRIYDRCMKMAEWKDERIAELTDEKEAMISRALEWLSDRINVDAAVEHDENGNPYAHSYAEYLKKRAEAIEEIKESFEKAIRGIGEEE